MLTEVIRAEILTAFEMVVWTSITSVTSVSMSYGELSMFCSGILAEIVLRLSVHKSVKRIWSIIGEI